MECNFDFLRAIRDRDLTQKVVAQRSGIDAAIISRIITGKYNASESEKEAINLVLGEDVFEREAL